MEPETTEELLACALAALERRVAEAEHWRKAFWSLDYDHHRAAGATSLDATAAASRTTHAVSKAAPDTCGPMFTPQWLRRRWERLSPP